MNKFALPLNKVIVLVPIVRKKSFMGKPKHDGVFMYTGTSINFVLPKSSSTGKHVDPLTKEEREFLEKELSINLNIHQKGKYEKGKLISGNIYDTYNITVKKSSEDLSKLKLTLHISESAEDYLKYKILLKCPNVAPAWENRNDTPEYEWALRDKNEEFVEKQNIAQLRREAYIWFSKIAGNKTKLIDYLRQLGENVDNGSTLSELEPLVDNYLQDNYRVRKVIELIRDKSIDDRIFLDKAIRVGAIKHSSIGKYTNIHGEILGNNRDEVITFFKDKVNSVFVNSIKDKILSQKL